MKKFLIVFVSFGIVASFLAGTGCGGDDGDTSATAGAAGSGRGDGAAEVTETTVTTSSRSKREFVQLANGICKRADANRVQEILQYAQEHQDEAGGVSGEELGIEAFRAVAVPKIPARVEQLRALGAPEGDEQRVEVFLVSLSRIADAPPRLLLRELQRSSELARAYGIDRCAYA